MPDLDLLAKAAYEAYGRAVGWRTFSGDPMPPWEADALPLRVREGWRAAAHAAAIAYAAKGAHG